MINLQLLVDNIQLHLRRRGNEISPLISSTACNVIGIFMGYEENHEFLIDSGIVSMIVCLMNEQIFEVRENATLAISNLLTSCKPQIIKYVVQEYSVLTPMLNMLDTEQSEVLIGILHSFVKMIEANELLNGEISITIDRIINEIDRERIEEISETQTSVASEMAQRLIEQISQLESQ